MATTEKTAIAPAAVRCQRDVLMLNTTVWEGTEYWMTISHSGEVCIRRQRSGEPASQEISIPRGTFKRMVDWWLKEQR